MKILYFDCFSGISGDMTLGALIDLGIDKDLFLNELRKLNLAGYDIDIKKVDNYGITCTDFDIKINKEYTDMLKKLDEHCGNDSSEHSHKKHGRHLSDIEGMIDISNLKKSIKELSKKIFREIAKAEAKVHNKKIEEVHFHEVGAVDSIIDIIGAAICFDILGVDKIISSPVHDGQGHMECEHGIIPVPVPAVMEMLSDSNIPYVCDNISTELVTPTGIAILKSTSTYYGNMPEMIIDKVGYGSGKKDIGKLNALRVVMGTLLDKAILYKEDVSILETNLDDTTPEMLGFIMEKLFNTGALDVYYTPIYMKKNRPSVKLTIITKKELELKITNMIFEETSTLGIRKVTSQRYVMNREIINVNTKYGKIRVKIGSKGEFSKFSPEYEDCRLAAIESNQPLWKIYHDVNKNVENGF
ncbi:MAG: nickel pincer cofactor biosynthesis protein LarC [Clostridiales bacterium]